MGVGLFKSIIKVAFFTIIITGIADIVIIVGDRLIVETRMWSIMTDMEETAEEHNGIPPMYIEEYEERLRGVAERSYLIESIEHNMTRDVTVGSEVFPSIGTRGEGANAPAVVHNYGDSMDIMVRVKYNYGTIFGTAIATGAENDGEVTINDIAEDGRGVGIRQTRTHWSRVMASELIK